MELVTQIVILATAIVGLYKAVTFHHNKLESAQHVEGQEQKVLRGQVITITLKKSIVTILLNC